MRVALLGVGRLGSFYARLLRAHPDVSELALFDVDEARAASHASALGAQAAHSSDAALNGVDAAVIATPSATHAGLIHRCLDAGIPCFCEKPIALGMTQAREVAEHVAATGGVLQVGFQRRFDAGFQAARQQMEDGRLGRVYSFSMVSRDALPPPDGYIASSGGLFRDLHIHDFDMVRWLFRQEVEMIYAIGSVFGLEHYREFGDVATSAIALRLTEGTLGMLTGARHNPAGYDIRVEIFGSRDSIGVGLSERMPLRSVETDGPALSGPPFPNFFVRFADAYRNELAHFLKLARGEAGNPCTAQDAMAALRIAEAAERSCAEGVAVRLNEHS